MSKENFFNQIGLSLLSFTGTPFEEHVIPMAITSNKSGVFFETQISLLTQLKNKFIKK